MPATTFEVHVAIDDDVLRSKEATLRELQQIRASFAASLDHWIAERRLELT
jgi:hypothetical protein